VFEYSAPRVSATETKNGWWRGRLHWNKIDSTLSRTWRHCFFTCVPTPLRTDFSGWLCFGWVVLFCSAQEMLLLFEPLCVVRPWGVLQARATCFRVFAKSGIFKLTNTEFVRWLQFVFRIAIFGNVQLFAVSYFIFSRSCSELWRLPKHRGRAFSCLVRTFIYIIISL
jgi:hypothetical protein